MRNVIFFLQVELTIPVMLLLILLKRDGSPVTLSKLGPEDDDILLFATDEGDNKNAVTNSDKKWRNHTIPYEIVGMRQENIDILMSILQNLEQVTCIRFRQRTNRDLNYVRFDAQDGRCASYVGMMEKITTGQIVALGRRCMTKGVVEHELMHLLGFWHEHQRSDRDQHVKINKDNIIPSKVRHFQVRSTDESMIVGAYDYKSLLHYDAFAFTKNGDPTIQRLEGGLDLGNRMGMSDHDVEKINILYKCDDNPSRRPIEQCDEFQDCKDDFEEECQKQAKAGWCKRMPGKMLLHCKRSCCNCNGTACYDTSNKYFYTNYCAHFFDKDNNRYIYAPETCTHPTSTETTRNYCPKMCNMCGQLGNKVD